MLRNLFLIATALLFVAPLRGQQSLPSTYGGPRDAVTGRGPGGPGYYGTYLDESGREPIGVVDMWPVYCFRRPADLRRYERLIYNLKKVYPIAKLARQKLAQAETDMAHIHSRKAQNEYIKRMEKELKQEYTPVLKKMTYAQGKILIKLIDRETDHTTYELIKQFKGSFSAFMWQGVARLFTANLKTEYDPKGEDRVIEQLILLYEAGLL